MWSAARKMRTESYHMAPVWAVVHSLYNLLMFSLFPNIRDKRAPANMTIIKNIHPNKMNKLGLI